MKKSIDDHFKNFDRDFEEKFTTTKKTVKAGLIGGGLGLAAGVVGGIYLGESLNDYIEVLKQAPAAIQYAVDGVSAVVCGGVGASIGGAVVQLPGMYKLFKKF